MGNLLYSNQWAEENKQMVITPSFFELQENFSAQIFDVVNMDQKWAYFHALKEELISLSLLRDWALSVERINLLPKKEYKKWRDKMGKSFSKYFREEDLWELSKPQYVLREFVKYFNITTDYDFEQNDTFLNYKNRTYDSVYTLLESFDLIKEVGDKKYIYQEDLDMLDKKNWEKIRNKIYSWIWKYLPDNERSYQAGFLSFCKHYQICTNISFKENPIELIDKKIENFLLENEAKRLSLHTPKEKVPVDEIWSREEERGFLCIKRWEYYSKITYGDLDELFWYGVDKKVITGSNQLKYSDMSHMDFIPRKISKKRATPMYGNMRFTLPAKVDFEWEEYRVNPDTTKSLKVSDSLVMIYDDNFSFLLDISSDWEQQFLKAEETRLRLENFDVSNYIPVKKGESHQKYAKRIAKFYDINYLSTTYKELIDESDFFLQGYNIEDQLSFAVYYQSLGQDDKKHLQKMLKEIWKEVFSAFKICEFSQQKWNLILEIYKNLFLDNTCRVLKKLSEVVSLLDETKSLVSEEGDESGFYSSVMWKVIYFMEKFVDTWNENVQELMDNIDLATIESWLLFKNLKERGVQELNDLDKIGIDMKNVIIWNLNEQEKKKIKDDFMFLYKQNYDQLNQKKFLNEISRNLDRLIFSQDNAEIYMFYVEWKPVLSTYIEPLWKNKVYGGWFNAQSSFQEYSFGFWVFEKILERLEGIDVHALVFKEIENLPNMRHNILLRMYKKYGFEVVWAWEWWAAKYTTIVKKTKKC